jgi:hypothetical protein
VAATEAAEMEGWYLVGAPRDDDDEIPPGCQPTNLLTSADSVLQNHSPGI